MEHNEMDWQTSLDKVVAALSRSEWQVRARAVQVLAEFGDQCPLELLATAIVDQHKSVRVAALETCAALSYRVPIKLIEVGLHDSYWSVRAAAAWACSAFGEEAPIQSLLALLNDADEHTLVRASALHSLGVLKGHNYRQRIVEALYDVAWHVREVAAIMLGNMSERSAIPSLVAVSEDDPDVFVRCAAIIALGQMREDTPKEVLLAALDDKEQEVRDAAIEALGVLYGKR